MSIGWNRNRSCRKVESAIRDENISLYGTYWSIHVLQSTSLRWCRIRYIFSSMICKIAMKQENRNSAFYRTVFIIDRIGNDEVHQKLYSFSAPPSVIVRCYIFFLEPHYFTHYGRKSLVWTQFVRIVILPRLGDLTFGNLTIHKNEVQRSEKKAPGL